MSERLKALKQAQQALVSATETKKEMEEHAAFVEDAVLTGLPKLEKKINLEDSEDYAREAIVNAARSLGKDVTGVDVEKILNSSLDELLQENLYDHLEVAKLSVEGFSLSSLSSGDITADAFGLVTLSAEALQEGKITAQQIKNIAVSAAKTAGSIMALAKGSLAFGPMGAVAAIPAMAISYLTGEIEKEKQLRRMGMEMAKAKVSREEHVINAQLSEVVRTYDGLKRDLWQNTDNVVSDLAKTWHRCEKELGVSFTLRFFPGEAPPPRGGYWTLGETISAPCVPVPAVLGGSEYFPYYYAIPRYREGMTKKQFTEAVKASIEKKQAWQQRRGVYTSACKAGPAPKEFYGSSEFPSTTNWGTGYEFFSKTVRALNALVPVGVEEPIWAPEGHPIREELEEWASYRDLVYLAQWEEIGRQPRSKKGAYEDYLLAHSIIEEYKLRDEPSGVTVPDMFEVAQQYMESKFFGLSEEYGTLRSFQARVLADIVQTASAVRSEMEIVKQLNAAGYIVEKPVLGSKANSFSAEEKRAIQAQTPSGYSGSGVNNAMLLTGSLVAAWGLWKRYG